MKSDSFDLMWSRVTRVSAFICGIGIMVYETVGDQGDRPWLYAAALGMMGLPLARPLERVLAKLGGSEAPAGDEVKGRRK